MSLALKNTPVEAYTWLTDELASKLQAIRGQHAAKKRRTVMLIAFARANQTPLAEVFKQPDTCSDPIWYTKWQYIPEIKAALAACYQAALAHVDRETFEMEGYWHQQRRRKLAELAAQAPDALAEVMGDGEQKGADRIAAAETLLKWADPENAGRINPGAQVSVSTTNTAQAAAVTTPGYEQLSDEELEDAIARELQGEQLAIPVSGAAETPAE